MINTLCHCTRLRRAAHSLTQLYDQALQDTGITVTQFSLLRTIVLLEKPYSSSLAEATGLERSTLGRNLRTLERVNLIEYMSDKDARVRLIRLSPEGKRVLHQAIDSWNEVQGRVLKAMGEKKLNELETLLSEISSV